MQNKILPIFFAFLLFITIPVQAANIPISIVASGDTAGGAAPIMVVYIDGSKVNQTSITANHSKGQTQTVTINRSTLPQKIEIAFTNDYWNSKTGADRNLYIISLTVNGTKYLPTQALLDAGSTTWADSSHLQPGQQELAGNSKLDFTIAQVTPINGICGVSNGTVLISKPTTGFCNAGTSSTVSGNGPWNWSCAGSNGGTTSQCSAQLLAINGSCGTANGTSGTTKPTANLCNSGTTSAVNGNGPWTWSCTGSNGGATAQCSENLLVNGTCGSASGAVATTMPATNLCNNGTASAISGNNPWIWSCVGQNGGKTANCATLPQSTVNGTCGPANGRPINSAPTSGLCTTGTALAVSGNGPWSWNCSGSNGGTNASCSAPLLANLPGVNVDFSSPTQNVVTGALWGVGTGGLIDNSFVISNDAVFQNTAAGLNFQLLRLNVNSGDNEGYWEDAIFAKGVNNPDWSYLDTLFATSPKFLSSSSALVVGLGPTGGNVTRSTSDWATIATQLASHFKSQGREVFYWEVGNEPSISVNTYIADFNAIAKALHSFNPNYKVGGPVSAWDDGSWIAPWAQQCGASADFTDWHSYPVNLTDSDLTMYQKGIAGEVENVPAEIAGTPMANKPLALLEYNISGNPEQDARQKTYQNAVFTALRLTETFKQDSMFQMAGIWDVVGDGNYGLLGSDGSAYSNILPVGYYLSEAGQTMPGVQIPATVTMTGNVKVFATENGDDFAIQIINYDTAASYNVGINITAPSGESINGIMNVWQIGSTHSTPALSTMTPGSTLSLPPATVAIITGTF